MLNKLKIDESMTTSVGLWGFLLNPNLNECVYIKCRL